MRPNIEYVAAVWNLLQKHLIKIIENVQHRASKLVLGMPELTYRDRLNPLTKVAIPPISGWYCRVVQFISPLPQFIFFSDNNENTAETKFKKLK